MIDNVVELALERMSIFDACNHIGMSIYPGYRGKLYCPWGDLFHQDAGASKAFRVYQDSAWCFAESMYFNSVKLIARDKDLSEVAAAEYILDITGYVPPDIESQWAAVTATVESVNPASYAEALKTYCKRISPDWEVRQFDPSVSTKLRKCLELTAQVHTEEEATKWLAVTKQVMAHELGDSHVSSG